MEFVKTSSSQWIRRDSEDCFTVVEIRTFIYFFISEIKVDFTKYSKENIEFEIRDHFPTHEHLKSAFPNNWKQVVAKMISENIDIDDKNDKCFEDSEDIAKYLKEKYNINDYS